MNGIFYQSIQSIPKIPLKGQKTKTALEEHFFFVRRMDLIIYDEALVCVALITQRKAESSAFFFLIGEIFCFGGGSIAGKGNHHLGIIFGTAF